MPFKLHMTELTLIDWSMIVTAVSHTLRTSENEQTREKYQTLLEKINNQIDIEIYNFTRSDSNSNENDKS